MISYTVRMNSARLHPNTHTQPLRVWEALCQTRVPIQHHADGLGLKLWLCNRLMLTEFYRLLRTPELAKAFICIVLCVASMQFSKVALWEMFFWEYRPCMKISANLFVAIFYFARRDSRFTEDRWILYYQDYTSVAMIHVAYCFPFTWLSQLCHWRTMAMHHPKHRMRTLWSCDQSSGWLRRIGTRSEKYADECGVIFHGGVLFSIFWCRRLVKS